MSEIDRTTNWEQYEEGLDNARNIIENGTDVLSGIRNAIDQYTEDYSLSKPGRLSYKFGYLDVIIKALEDESERVKNDILNYYIEGDNEDERESGTEFGNDDSDGKGTDLSGDGYDVGEIRGIEDNCSEDDG